MSASCCKVIGKKDDRYTRDIYDRPLLGSKVGDCINFYKEDGERVCASSNGIEYVYGTDSLLSYISSYYSDPRNNFRDYNRMELFIVLFDEKLKIIEIRNTKLINQNIKAEYFDIINDKIKNTQGLWKKKRDSQWYYYPILYKLH